MWKNILHSLGLSIITSWVVLFATAVMEGTNAMKKCVMIASVALVLTMALISCSDSSDPLTAEDRAMSEGRREVQETRPPPGPPNAAMIQDETPGAGGTDSGGTDSGD